MSHFINSDINGINVQPLENNGLLKRAAIVWLSFSLIFFVLSLLLFHSPIEIHSTSEPLALNAIKKSVWSVWETGSQSEHFDGAALGSLLVNNRHINYSTGETPTRNKEGKKCLREVKQNKNSGGF